LLSLFHPELGHPKAASPNGACKPADADSGIGVAARLAAIQPVKTSVLTY
jgi:hypothetical protein